MNLSLQQIFLGLGVVFFILGLIYVVSYYAQGEGDVEECRKQHRTQAWTTLVVGLILLFIWGIINIIFRQRLATAQYY